MTDIASPLFPLGRTLAAPGALDALARPGNDPGTGFGTLLTRHVTGDWGELDNEDQATNDWAVVFGDERLVSHYRLPDQTSIWVTEGDRSAITVLLPTEYQAAAPWLIDALPGINQPRPRRHYPRQGAHSMTRLVNVYVVQSSSTDRWEVTTVTIRSGADGTPEPAHEHARRTGASASSSTTSTPARSGARRRPDRSRP